MKMRSAISPCCPPVFQARLARRHAEELATLFKALADPVRLQLLSFIAAQPSGEACVCRLTQPVGLSQPTVSHHLRLLYEAGLLDRDQRGNWVYYRIVPKRLAALRAVLGPRSRGRASIEQRPPSKGPSSKLQYGEQR